MAGVRIGLSMIFCLGEPFRSLLKHLQEADVGTVEIVDEGLLELNSVRVAALRKVIKSRGLEVTIHAPFTDINIASPIPFLRRVFLKRLEKSITYARQMDCRLWVFHPGAKTGIGSFYPGLDWQMNLDSVRKLLCFSKEQNVKIAIENLPEPYPFFMKSADDFSLFYNELGQDIGLVLDVGHANVNKQIQTFVTRFSKKIVHIHLSDNDGTYDQHLGIGRGNIDWAGFAREVKAMEYNKVLMLESTEHVKESLQALRNLFA